MSEYRPSPAGADEDDAKRFWHPDGKTSSGASQPHVETTTARPPQARPSQTDATSSDMDKRSAFDTGADGSSDDGDKSQVERGKGLKVTSYRGRKVYTGDAFYVTFTGTLPLSLPWTPSSTAAFITHGSHRNGRDGLVTGAFILVDGGSLMKDGRVRHVYHRRQLSTEGHISKTGAGRIIWKRTAPGQRGEVAKWLGTHRGRYTVHRGTVSVRSHENGTTVFD